MLDIEDYLAMSGIQHFYFCPRQWALIHLEQQWCENLRTAQGQIEHSKCHDEQQTEKRGDRLITRGMRVVSHHLHLTGICDVVEFYATEQGVPLQGREGCWLPMPVEYKHGVAKENNADRLQLCAQAMALEEMLVCEISQAALYYAQSHQREIVTLSQQLRQETQELADEMQRYFMRGYTPKVQPGKHCNACSLKELCLPVLCRRLDPQAYLKAHLQEIVEMD